MKITLEDFPDNIYVLLEDDFRRKLFNTATSIVGDLKNLAKLMKVSYPSILAWQRAITGNKKIQFCSVKNIKLLSNLLLKNSYDEFKLENIQNHVKAYRDRAGRLWVCNPKLPIEDSIELREVIIHLMCDGSAIFTPRRTAKYTNTSEGAINEFSRRLSVFGNILRKGKEDIKYRAETRKDRIKPTLIYVIPKAIPRILAKKFDISFDTFNSRIPSEFFNGDRLLLASVVRAFLVDEGHVKDTSASFTSANIMLLEDLRKICGILGYKYSKIRNKRRTYEFSILTKSILNFYEDVMKIGKIPIEGKQRLLELAVTLVKTPKRRLRGLDKTILGYLYKNPSTISQLALRTNVRQLLIWKNLKELEKGGKVKVIGKVMKQGGPNIWSI